ncbi:MAG: hypothetical protein AB3N13_02360 [Arenibacterium sp.]
MLKHSAPANQLTRLSQEIGCGYPGLYPWIDDARLRFHRCRNVVLRGLHFSQSWPPHVFIENARDITIRDCHFKDATFCIAASGATTKTWPRGLSAPAMTQQS